jgi:hypothetical protein
MSMKLKVGASQRVIDNDLGVRSGSVSLELDLEPTLVNDPGQLQKKIRLLFRSVRALLAEDLEARRAHPERAHPANGRSAASASPPDHDRVGSVENGAAWRAQVRALQAIIRQQRSSGPRR